RRHTRSKRDWSSDVCSSDLSSIGFDELDRLAVGLGGRVTVAFDAPFLADRSAQRDRVHARCMAYVASRLERDGWVAETEVEIHRSEERRVGEGGGARGRWKA